MCRAYSRFIALCARRGHKVDSESAFEWLKSIYPADREEALRLLWFRLDETDRRNAYIDLLAYQAQGLERLVTGQQKLINPGIRLHQRWATHIEMTKTKNVLDKLDLMIERARLGIEDTKEEFALRWPAIVRQYGDPLATRPFKLPPPRPLLFGTSEAADPRIAFDQARKALAELKADTGQVAEPYISRRADAARLKRYRSVLSGECGEAFADLEQLGVDSPRIAAYATRLLEWLLTLEADDRAAGFRLSALLSNRAELQGNVDRFLERDRELARVAEKAKSDHKDSLADELSSEREVSRQAAEILQVALGDIDLTLQRNWSDFLHRYGDPPVLGPVSSGGFAAE